MNNVRVKLYKYLPGGFCPLHNGLIRFTQAIHLNDIQEVTPVINSFRNDASLNADIDEIEGKLNWPAMVTDSVNQLISTMPPEVLEFMGGHEGVHQFVAEKFVLDDPSKLALLGGMRQHLTNVVRQAEPEILKTMSTVLRERAGVLCLTRRPDNELMWAHYANSFKGYLIEFDGAHPFFHTNDPDLEGLSGMIPVEYRSRKPVMDQFVDQANSLQALFFVKSQAWEYEEEWRMVRIFSDNDVVVGEEQSVHLFPFPLDSVTGIVFGQRMSTVDREALLAPIQALEHIQLYEAGPDARSNAIIIMPWE